MNARCLDVASGQTQSIAGFDEMMLTANNNTLINGDGLSRSLKISAFNDTSHGRGFSDDDTDWSYSEIMPVAISSPTDYVLVTGEQSE